MGKSKKKEPEIISTSSLTPEQNALSKAISGYLEPLIGQGVTPYTGQVVAGQTPEELTALQGLRDKVAADPTLINAYQRYLSGEPSTTISPEATEEYFQKEIFDPTIRRYREEILPLMGEQYIGSGTYWGNARAEAQRKALRDVAEDLTGQYATLKYQDELSRRDLAENAANRALTAGGQLGQLRSEEFGRQQNLLQAEGVSRLLNQAQLDWDYNEFLRTQPEAAPYITYALQLLGIPMLTQMGVQGQQGGNLGGIGTGAGSLIGALLE